MNQRLIKEGRDLLPTFAGALLLIVAPFLILHGNAGGIGYVAFGLACAVLSGSSFGNEFQHRTFSLLLSQPVERSVLWRDKMLVLGAGILISLAVLVACLLRYHPESKFEQWPLVLLALCAFCGAPYWTLLLRQGIGGVAFAAAVPVCLLLVNALVTERLLDNEAVEPYSAAGLLLIYCAFVYGLGYAKFRRLQVVDGSPRELALPAGLESLFVRPLSRISARIQGQFASLLRKEFRLQQTSFMLAGLFVLVAATGACVVRFHSDWGGTIVGGDYIIYVLMLPVIAGAMSIAEEKGWDLAEWHLTLPPSALRQWSAKMLAALSTSFILGVVLPAILLLVGDALFAKGDARSSLPPASLILCWVLGQLLLTSLAVYAASFTNTTLKAILAAFAIIIAGCSVCYVLADCATIIIAPRLLELRRPTGQLSYDMERFKIVLPLLLAGGLYLVLCLVHWFAWSNFRRSKPSPGSVVVQVLVFLLACGLITLAIAVAIFVVVAKGTVLLK